MKSGSPINRWNERIYLNIVLWNDFEARVSKLLKNVYVVCLYNIKCCGSSCI